MASCHHNQPTWPTIYLCSWPFVKQGQQPHEKPRIDGSPPIGNQGNTIRKSQENPHQLLTVVESFMKIKVDLSQRYGGESRETTQV